MAPLRCHPSNTADKSSLAHHLPSAFHPRKEYMNATDTPLAPPDSPTADQLTEMTVKPFEKERSKTHVRAGITKNKGKGLSKAIRVMSRNSRRINRKRG